MVSNTVVIERNRKQDFFHDRELIVIEIVIVVVDVIVDVILAAIVVVIFVVVVVDHILEGPHLALAETMGNAQV